MSEEQIQTSKYHSGVSKEIRRSELWKDANSHSRNGQYSKWNEDLDTIWIELCADLIPKKKDFLDETNLETFNKYKEKFDEFDKKLITAGKFTDIKSDDFQNPDKSKLEARNNHYKILMEKEVFLKMLENYLGKGTQEKDDDEDGLDE